MPWNFFCDPWVSWRFYKTTIIRQLTKWNESKIEKYSKKPLGLCMNLYVCLWVCVCVCVCVGYSCVLLSVYVWVVYSAFVCEGTCAVCCFYQRLVFNVLLQFDPGFKRPAYLATLKSSDRTKQSVCGWQYIYIFIYIYMYIYIVCSHIYIYIYIYMRTNKINYIYIYIVSLVSLFLMAYQLF